MGLDVAEIGMGADLCLDLRHFTSKAVRQAKDAPAASHLDAFIRQLEEEQGKIVAFRSELPLCVRIVAYAIDDMKAEKKRTYGEEEEDGAAGDKSKWMSTAQLWTGGSDRDAAESEKQGRSALVGGKSLGGAFVPFKGVGSGAPAFGPPPYTRKDDDNHVVGVPDLSLLTPPALHSAPPAAAAAAFGGGGGVSDESRRHVVGFAQAAATAAAMAPPAPALILQPQPQPQQPQPQQQQQQPGRKCRRSWSPELHRQFVDALDKLGGPYVATPKQIRELMKVDGLTNDEVKSHLQKYRLHTRRAPAAGSAVVNQQPMMVMGGLWIPHPHEPASSSYSHQSASPQGPLHFSTATGSGIFAASSAATASGGEEDDDSYGWI